MLVLAGCTQEQVQGFLPGGPDVTNHTEGIINLWVNSWIVLLVVGLITCGLGAVIWGIIDAVLILTDKVRDPQGRPLRDGT